VYGAIIIGERLEFEADTWFLAGKLVWACADRLLHEPVRPGLLIIAGRNHPPRTAYIAGAEQNRKIEERLLEVEAQGVVPDDLHRIRLLVKHLAPGAVIVLVTPFHIDRSHW
jgi:hypothetical protein